MSDGGAVVISGDGANGSLGFEGGDGTLEVLTGGSISFDGAGRNAARFAIGYAAGSDSTATIDGAGSSFSIDGLLAVGAGVSTTAANGTNTIAVTADGGGNGTVVVSNDGEVTAGEIFVGDTGRLEADGDVTGDLTLSGILSVGGDGARGRLDHAGDFARSGDWTLNLDVSAFQTSGVDFIQTDDNIAANVFTNSQTSVNLALGEAAEFRAGQQVTILQTTGTVAGANVVVEADGFLFRLVEANGNRVALRADSARQFGTDGDDRLTGGNFNDELSGGSGNDSLIGRLGDDTLMGEAGDDLLNSAQGDDQLFGGEGNDNFVASTGDDTLFGGAGDDNLNAGGDNDLVVGGSGNDRMIGGNGDDTLNGQANDDRLIAGNGDDGLFGGSGNDVLIGFNGADTLDGGTGNDNLFAGDGSDQLSGGAGNDFYNGGADGDADTLIFDLAGFGRDRVANFENGVDVFDLTGSGITQLSDFTITQLGDGSTRLQVDADNFIRVLATNQSLIDETDFIFDSV